MLPVLDSNNALDQQYLDYLTALAKAGFSGDIETQYSSRLAMATDNSIYQKLPQAIVYPKNIQDLTCIGQVVQGFSDDQLVTTINTTFVGPTLEKETP